MTAATNEALRIAKDLQDTLRANGVTVHMDVAHPDATPETDAAPPKAIEGIPIPLPYQPGSDLTLGGRVEFTATQLVIKETLTWEQAEFLATSLQIEYMFSRHRLPWYIGDILLDAERRFGEDYAQLILSKFDTWEVKTLQNYRWVAGRIPPQVRRAELKFSYHAEVAGLSDGHGDPDHEEMALWLQRAIDHAWTRQDLRDAMREARRLSEPEQEELPNGDVADDLPGDSMTVTILGLAELSETDPLRRIKTTGIPALATFIRKPGKAGQNAERALWDALDRLLDDWYARLEGLG